MEFKGTKGQWHHKIASSINVDNDGRIICEAGYTGDIEEVSNLHLISQAPDMLKTLQFIYEYGLLNNDVSNTIHNDIEQLLKKILR